MTTQLDSPTILPPASERLKAPSFSTLFDLIYAMQDMLEIENHPIEDTLIVATIVDGISCGSIKFMNSGQDRRS